MAHGYTFEREENGYRFFPDADTQQTPFFQSGKAIGLAIVFGVIALVLNIKIVALAVFGGAGWLFYARSKRTPMPDQKREGGFLVTPEAIVTRRGDRIAANRINSLKITNSMDATNSSYAHSRAVVVAGTTAAAADNFDAAMRRRRTATRYILTVQHGPNESVLALRLDANGANGLRADVERVLRGQRLD